MQSNTELILEESGIEIIVVYEYEKTDGYYEETENANTYVPPSILTELKSVEVVIKSKGIDILPSMNEKQKEHIISLLSYENETK